MGVGHPRDGAVGELARGGQRPGRQGGDELDVRVVLVCGTGDVEPLRGGLELIRASEVIGMDADPGSSVRTMKGSSLVRAAEAVRERQRPLVADG